MVNIESSRGERVPGELLFRVTTGHVTLLRPKRLADAPPMFILSMSLISKAFVPDSIFRRDREGEEMKPWTTMSCQVRPTSEVGAKCGMLVCISI